jgi:hypothetical protein
MVRTNLRDSRPVEDFWSDRGNLFLLLWRALGRELELEKDPNIEILPIIKESGERIRQAHLTVVEALKSDFDRRLADINRQLRNNGRTDQGRIEVFRQAFLYRWKFRRSITITSPEAGRLRDLLGEFQDVMASESSRDIWKRRCVLSRLIHIEVACLSVEYYPGASIWQIPIRLFGKAPTCEIEEYKVFRHNILERGKFLKEMRRAMAEITPGGNGGNDSVWKNLIKCLSSDQKAKLEALSVRGDIAGLVRYLQRIGFARPIGSRTNSWKSLVGAYK